MEVPGVEEFSTDGTDGVEKMIGGMLALHGSADEADTCPLEMLRHGDDSGALRGPGVLAVPSVRLDVFGLRQVVASLDLASVSLRGQC